MLPVAFPRVRIVVKKNVEDSEFELIKTREKTSDSTMSNFYFKLYVTALDVWTALIATKLLNLAFLVMKWTCFWPLS